MLTGQLVEKLQGSGDPDGPVVVFCEGTYCGVTSAGQVSGTDPIMTVIEAGTHAAGLTRTQLIDLIMEEGGDPDGEAELFADDAYYEVGEVYRDDAKVSPGARAGNPVPTVLKVGDCTAT